MKEECNSCQWYGSPDIGSLTSECLFPWFAPSAEDLENAPPCISDEDIARLLAPDQEY